MPTVSSLSQTLKLGLLKTGRGLLDHGSPTWSVSGMFSNSFVRIPCCIGQHPICPHQGPTHMGGACLPHAGVAHP